KGGSRRSPCKEQVQLACRRTEQGRGERFAARRAPLPARAAPLSAHLLNAAAVQITCGVAAADEEEGAEASAAGAGCDRPQAAEGPVPAPLLSEAPAQAPGRDAAGRAGAG